VTETVRAQFQRPKKQLRDLGERNLGELDVVAILINGISFGKQVLVVALDIESSGKKQVLGVWQGATENTAVVKDLLEDLVTRGLSTERRYFFVIDDAKALRTAIERVFGDRADVQRYQLHKRRNVAEYLPKNAQGDYDRRIRNPYAMTDYAEAKAELEKIVRQLERVNPSAARSLEEGLEETLTVHRLGVGELLRCRLSTTNSIESCLSTVERVVRRVKTLARWRSSAALDSYWLA
jgi:transposase-like protein